MKKFHRYVRLAFSLALILSPCAWTRAQTVNASQQVSLEGLLSANNHGTFTAAAYASDGTLILLLDEHDGVRLLKANSSATAVLASAHAGSTGDSGIAMSLDPSGNIYVTGTTISGSLSGTSGVAFPTAADTSTNSFLAKYDSNLNLLFLTFLGAGRTAVASVAATADAAFVTGITFNAAFPVTVGGIQQAPASGSSENGFVERFSPDGTTLVYATYLTGVNGNTIPSAIAADASDDAFLTGLTTSSGFPTIAALEPSIFGATSGFLARLTPTGSSFTFSTFIAGNGLTSLAFDAASNSLLLSGNVALGQFPVATVAMPLTSASYQTLLRIPVDGQSVSASVLLVPGTQSFVSVGPAGTAWVAGALATPLFPGSTPPDFTEGDSFLLHVTATNAIDQTLRFGGLPPNNQSYASLVSTVAAPAIASGGAVVALPGSITATVSSSLLSTERFNLALVAAPNSLLPNTLRDVLPSATACGSSSQCSGSGGWLALVNATTNAPSLALSTDNLPNVTLRNVGSATANGLAIVANGYSVASNCGSTLAASGECTFALTGVGPGSLTASAANASTYSVQLPANSLTPDPIAISTGELDFGIETSTNPPATRTLNVTNLTGTTQTFSAAKDGGAKSTPYAIAVSSSDCASAGVAGSFTVAANATCHLSFSLSVSSSAANDGPVYTVWKVATRDVVLTAFAQAASLNLSAAEVDFGTQFTGAAAIRLPRYLYLSNHASVAVAHAAATLPPTSPFTLADACPSMLEPHSICRLALNYSSSTAPSHDAVTLTLDQGLSVLVTGTTLQPASVTGSSTNPSLSVSPLQVSFATPVVVTGISTSTQTVTVKNTGAVAFTLATAISGDFALTNGCGASLAGGASCSLLIAFAPSQPGTRQGVLSLTAGSGFAPTYVSLSGTGLAILPANNGTLDLGQTLVGEPVVQWYRVQQSLTSLTVATGSPQFGVALVANTGAVPTSLPPSLFAQNATAACNNCYLGVQFLAQNAGLASTSLTLSTLATGNVYPVTLIATALPVQGLLLTPVAQDFGPIAINSSSAPVTFTLANLLTPAAATSVQSVSASGDFSIAANATGGASCTGALASTASCFVQVIFAPSATGVRTGTLAIVTAAGSVSASLSGFGSADSGLAINPTSLNFTSVPGSASTQQTVTLSNSGTAGLSIGVPSASDPSFGVVSGCSTLVAGATCTLTISFTPQSAPVAATLSIPVTSTVNGQTSTTIYTVALNGTYTVQNAGLEILPSVVNFGSTATGAVGTARQFTLNNLSGKSLTVTLVLPRQFALATAAPCPTLAAGASCTFAVDFIPATAGALTGTVFAQGAPADGSAGVEALGYLLGYGSNSGQLSISGTSAPGAPLNFGQVTSGQSLPKTLTITNNEETSFTVHRITSAPPFLATSSCGLLAPGSSCTVTVTYAPVYEVATGTSASPRTDAGTLVIESDAGSSPDSVALTGIATALVSPSPSSSAVIASYALSQGSLTFPQTAAGSRSAVQAVTLTNTGTTTIHVASVSASADFYASTNCSTVVPGANCNLAAQFTPSDSTGPPLRAGTAEIVSDAGDTLEFISLFGSAGTAPLTFNPPAVVFGTVAVGSSGVLSVSVTNTSGSTVTILGLSATGDFSVSGGTCPAIGGTLAAGASCSLSVTFAPTAGGSRSGTLSVTTDVTALPLTVSLTGTAAASALSASPSPLAFGNVGLGIGASQSVVVSNSGTSPVTNIVATVSGTDAADVAVTTACAATLAANAGCTMSVTFTPSAMGTRAAVLTISSSDPGGPLVVALSGSGVAAPSFALSVNGVSSASVAVVSGIAASFPLTLTPLNGFTGSVALTCTPVIPAQYASCSLLASTLTLGAGPQASTATINTVTSASSGRAGILGRLLSVPMATIFLFSLSKPKRRRKKRKAAALLLAVVIGVGISGCGGGSSSSGSSKLLYTPAGTYQYQVTATSTSGTQVTSTVTLNLIVQ